MRETCAGCNIQICRLSPKLYQPILTANFGIGAYMRSPMTMNVCNILYFTVILLNNIGKCNITFTTATFNY